MTTAVDAPPSSSSARRWFEHGPLESGWIVRAWLVPPLVAGAIIACGFGPLFAPGEPAGADSMLHVNDAWCFARAARALDPGMWCDGGSLGYPLAVAYQPLPAMFVALLHLALGVALVSAAKIAIALPLALSPLAFACGARLGGLDRVRAAAFGVACGCVLDVVNYGLGPRVLLNTGLLPQAWAHAMAPVAVGAALAFLVHGRFGGVATWAIVAVALCHPLIAVEAAVVGGAVLAARVVRRRAMPLAESAHAALTERENGGQAPDLHGGGVSLGALSLGTLRRRALALAATSGTALAFYIVTLATDGANNVGLVVLPGAARTDMPLLLGTGALLDHQRALPLLTIFVVVGAVLAAAPFLRACPDRPVRALAVALAAVLVWSAFAADVEALPSPLRMTTRVAPLAQVLACWLAVEAAVDLVTRALSLPPLSLSPLSLSPLSLRAQRGTRSTRTTRNVVLVIAALAIVAVLAIPTALTIRGLARNPFARRPVVRAAFQTALAEVRALPPGNIAVSGRETRGWRHLMLVEAEHPLVWVTMGAPASASSMTFRIVMADALSDPWRYGVVGVLEDEARSDASARWHVRRTNIAERGVADGVISADAPDSKDVRAIDDVRVAPSSVRAHVVAGESGARLLVRRSYHSWWRARVDGAPVDVEVLRPSMVGVRVPAGAHEVELAFVRPWWWWALVVASCAALLAFPIARLIRSRPRA